MAFTPARRGPLLSGAERKGTGREADPTIRGPFTMVPGAIADEAEYNLGGSAEGQFRAEWTLDEKPISGEWIVRNAAAIPTSALVRATTVLTATVASGAANHLQVGQWVSIAGTGFDAAADQYDGVHQIVTTTATTITFTVANTGVTTDAVVQDIVIDATVIPLQNDDIVLFDSIPSAADNQDYDLGAVQAGMYRVVAENQVEFIMSDGAAFLQHADVITTAGPLAVTHDEWLDATSDTLSSLFVSSGRVLFRDGADITTKVQVIFTPAEHIGHDINGSVCFYSKRESARPDGVSPELGPSTLRLKNRSGASLTFTSFERIR